VLFIYFLIFLCLVIFVKPGIFLFSSIVVLIILFVIITKPKYKRLGFIEFGYESLSLIDESGSRKEFPLDLISNFKFKVFQFDGEFYRFKQIVPSSGNLNFILFNFENKEYQFEIFLKSEHRTKISFIKNLYSKVIYNNK
jgi:hypothetical protein